ncbi:MAG: hypothetical protein HZA16_05890 [Nitrospirae bacterium]|nr:hypothetical protein [Nitrospirota bacterium]
MDNKRLIHIFTITTAVLISASWGWCAQSQIEQSQIEWYRNIGGSSSDTAGVVRQTTDGGYIISGSATTNTEHDYDAQMTKTNPRGLIIWQKRFGGTAADYGTSVQQTAEGGFIMTGATRSFGEGYRDVWLIKTDRNGNEEWNRTFGGEDYDYGRSVQQTTDGGYIVSGYTKSFGAGLDDVLLIKTDGIGNEVWKRTFGGEMIDYGRQAWQTADGGYIIIGETISYASSLSKYDAWLIKTDADGIAEWTRTFGGLGDDRGCAVQQTADGGYIITGYTDSVGEGDYDLWLFKADRDGNEIWSKTFGGAKDDRGRSVQITGDGGYIIAGYTYSFGTGLDDMWIIKTDANGNKLWDRTIGRANSYDTSGSASQTADGGYVVLGVMHTAGTGEFNGVLIKLKVQQ